jgi:hypothetical protein
LNREVRGFNGYQGLGIRVIRAIRALIPYFGGDGPLDENQEAVIVSAD